LINLLLLHLLLVVILFINQLLIFLLGIHQVSSVLVNELSLLFQFKSLLIFFLVSELISATVLVLLAIVHHGGLVCSHFGDGSGVLFFADKLFDLQSEVRDHFDQLDILSHDVHVVLLVNLLLFLESLLKTSLRIFKISSLILILLLDIWINFDILHLLVLDIRIEVLVDSPFKLVKVINILNNPVNGILEALNEVIILSNLGFVFLNEFSHMLLSGSEIINNVTQISINFVVMLQVSVHIVGLFLQLSDF
jgi:hypothetical protein